MKTFKQKKSLLTIILFGITFFVFSQGTLQFNQVINNNITFSLDAQPDNDGTLAGNITVPAGKVLKLEWASMYTIDSSGQIEHIITTTSNVNYDTWLMIGEFIVFSPLTTVGASLRPLNKFPIWYGPGTYEIRARWNTVLGAGTQIKASYSALEFNVL